MEMVKVPARLENLEKMINFIVEKYKTLVHDKKSELRMRLVMEEALVNIINYAYPNSVGEIEIDYNFYEKKKILTIKIIDSGIPFNPLEKEEPDLSLSMEERQIGGLGIYMIKTIMDEVNYERVDGKNILIISKCIPKESIIGDDTNAE